MKFTKYEGNPKTVCHLWNANTMKDFNCYEIVGISK